MKQFDPNDRDPELMVSEPPPKERERGLTTIAIAAAVVVALGIGVYVVSNAPNDYRVATNTPPVTIGQSTTTPAPADAGKTDDN